MIKKLFKLEIIFIVLSLFLSFVILSCGDNKSNEKSLLDSALRLGVNYTGTTQDDGANMSVSLLVSKDNNLKITKVNAGLRFISLYKVTEINSMNDGTYKVSLKLISASITLLLQNVVDSANDGTLYFYKDYRSLRNWKLNEERNVTEQTSDKTKDLIIKISDNKNSISYDDGDKTITLKYQ